MKPVFHKPVAIGARLKKYPEILTLGFRPDFDDYSAQEKQLIFNAEKIYYPTAFYARLFSIMGKKIFPSADSYRFALDKIQQSAIFKIQNIPHPRTKVFYGKGQQQSITDHFPFPFVAKKARGSARGEHVYLIQSHDDLSAYLKIKGPAYIQEFLGVEKDLRIIVIGNKVRLAYWRQAREGNFKTNLSQGGTICFDPVPRNALKLALETAEKCGWNDVGIDIIEADNQFYVLEGNMKYGTKGFAAAGIDYKRLLVDLILKNEI